MYVDDNERLRHMLDAAMQAHEFVSTKHRNDIDSDPMLLFALLKALEIIGEAARGISNEFKETYPEIPWIEIIGMRNRLIHGYFDIEHDVVWDTVINDIPILIDQLKKLCDDEE